MKLPIGKDFAVVGGKTQAKTGPGPDLMGADTLLGEEVYNRNEEHLGEIKEIMLNIRTDNMAYTVLSFGGVLGLGEKLFTVP